MSKLRQEAPLNPGLPHTRASPGRAPPHGNRRLKTQENLSEKLDTAQTTDDLRTRRQAKQLSMQTVAEELDTNIMTVSRLERGLTHNRELTTRYHQWLDHTETA
jgi:hypothetical protein